MLEFLKSVAFFLGHPVDETICLVKSNICKTQQQSNACKGFVWESRIPHAILAHDLFGIEVCIASLRC